MSRRQLKRLQIKLHQLLSSLRMRGSRGYRTSCPRRVQPHVLWPLDPRIRGDDTKGGDAIGSETVVAAVGHRGRIRRAEFFA
jgi:hypothetical protein